MVECEVVVDARDGGLVAFLDERYERDDTDDDTTWRELFPLNEDVVRLIASFEHMPMGDLGMRPDRLRELLGL